MHQVELHRLLRRHCITFWTNQHWTNWGLHSIHQCWLSREVENYILDLKRGRINTWQSGVCNAWHQLCWLSRSAKLHLDLKRGRINTWQSGACIAPATLTFQKWKEENYIWTWKGGKENSAVQHLNPPTFHQQQLKKQEKLKSLIFVEILGQFGMYLRRRGERRE